MRDRYASLREGLVGAWIPSVSGSGLLLPDLSGQGNNGALTNMDASDWVSSQYGRALDFDGTNDHVNLGSSVLLHPATCFSVGGWCRIKTTVPSFQRLISSRSGLNTSDGFILSFTSGAPRFLVGNGTAFVTATANPDVATDTRWHHYIGTYSSGTSRFYIDGILQNSASVTVQHGNSTVLLGGDPSLNAIVFLNGQLDDVRIYNRALSDPEIKLLASRPGIGLRPQRRTMYYAPPTGARRRRILTSMP